jgi:hypothetical protein
MKKNAFVRGVAILAVLGIVIAALLPALGAFY